MIIVNGVSVECYISDFFSNIRTGILFLCVTDEDQPKLLDVMCGDFDSLDVEFVYNYRSIKAVVREVEINPYDVLKFALHIESIGLNDW